jgi:integrase
MDIHSSKRKLDVFLARFQAAEFSKKNRDLMIVFSDALLAEGLSDVRVLKYLYTLRKISGILGKDFDQVIKKDIVALYKQVNTSSFCAWTQHDYKIVIRRFYQWLNQETKRKPRDLQEAIKYISEQKVRHAKSREKTPEHMLLPEEVMQIAEHTNNSRDRAFVLTLYESMCRVGEIVPVRLKDCEHDEKGTKLFITGKTGRRYIRLIAASPGISNWMTNHPDRNNPEAFLFCGIGRTNQREMISYDAARKIVFEAAARAGIKKRVNLHKFRASRATELSAKLSESVLCKLGGWEQNSSQLREYVYLSGGDAEREVLRLHGLLKEEEDQKGFKSVVCPRCKQRNSPGSEYCGSCTLPLDEKTILNYDSMREQTITDLNNRLKATEEKMQLIVQSLEPFKKELNNHLRETVINNAQTVLREEAENEKKKKV